MHHAISQINQHKKSCETVPFRIVTNLRNFFPSWYWKLCRHFLKEHNHENFNHCFYHHMNSPDPMKGIPERILMFNKMKSYLKLKSTPQCKKALIWGVETFVCCWQWWVIFRLSPNLKPPSAFKGGNQTKIGKIAKWTILKG